MCTKLPWVLGFTLTTCVAVAGDRPMISRDVGHPDHAKEIAVERPDGRWIYLRDAGGLHCVGTTLEGAVVRIDPARAAGRELRDGVFVLAWAFDVPGHYVVWTADNLETEQDGEFGKQTPFEYRGDAVKRAPPDPGACTRSPP